MPSTLLCRNGAAKAHVEMQRATTISNVSLMVTELGALRTEMRPLKGERRSAGNVSMRVHRPVGGSLGEGCAPHATIQRIFRSCLAGR